MYHRCFFTSVSVIVLQLAFAPNVASAQSSDRQLPSVTVDAPGAAQRRARASAAAPPAPAAVNQPAVIQTTAGAGLAEPAGADAASIGQLLHGMFDKPNESLSVGPVVVSGDHAIAGWTQGDMGGRALLRRKQGAWAVTLCAGDAIKSSEALKTAGVPQPDAIHLAQALASAESSLAPERVAMFARFEGLVMMDGTSGHATGHPGHPR